MINRFGVWCPWVWKPGPVQQATKRFPLELYTRDGREFARPARLIFSASAIRAQYPKLDRRTKIGRILKRKLELAEEYEAEVESARERSGYGEASSACYYAEGAIEELAREVRDLAPASLAGILIYVRAFLAWDRVDADSSGEFRRVGSFMGVPLAQSILRLGSLPIDRQIASAA
jgi:hypothetical protein